MRGFTEKILFLNIHNYSNDIAIDITHSTKILIRSLAIFFSNSNWHCIHTRMTRKKMLHRREKYGCIRRAYTDLYSPQCKERQGQLRNAVSEVICIWNSVCIRALRKTLPGVFPPSKSAGLSVCSCVTSQCCLRTDRWETCYHIKWVKPRPRRAQYHQTLYLCRVNNKPRTRTQFTFIICH